jgi:integrase
MGEIDLGQGVWTIPAHRMKAGKEHRVPLSARALAIITDLNEARVSDYVFPGQKPGRPLSVMAFDMLMRRMNADAYTAHGFRSSFRDWAGDCTSFPREIAEAALAHKVGDAVELAYRRSDALKKRRTLMQAWADYCANAIGGKVIPMVRQ